MAKEKILIIEDNPMNMELFIALLEPDGYLIFQATTGKDGFKIAKSEMPDLILLDPGLPDIDGIDMIKKFKQNPATKAITLVICTASVMKEEREKMISSDCDGFISKPIDTREFLKTIDELLRNPKDNRYGSTFESKRGRRK